MGQWVPPETQHKDIPPQRRKERQAIFLLKNQEIFSASFASLRQIILCECIFGGSLISRTASPFLSGGDERRDARNHFRVAQDAAMTEAGGADELRARPGLRHRGAFLPRDVAVVLVVNDQTRHVEPARQDFG